MPRFLSLASFDAFGIAGALMGKFASKAVAPVCDRICLRSQSGLENEIRSSLRQLLRPAPLTRQLSVASRAARSLQCVAPEPLRNCEVN